MIAGISKRMIQVLWKRYQTTLGLGRASEGYYCLQIEIDPITPCRICCELYSYSFSAL